MNKIVFWMGFLISVVIASTDYYVYDSKGRFEKKVSAKEALSAITSVQKEHGPLYIKKHNANHKKTETLKIADTTIFFGDIGIEHNDFWIEIEKNQTFMTCFEKNTFRGVISKLEGRVVNDSCFQIESSDLVGSSDIVILDENGSGLIKIHVSVGMKYLDLSKSKHKPGFYGNDYDLRVNSIFNDSNQNMENRIYPDPERVVTSNNRFLVDTYLATNCEIVSVLSNNISLNPKISNKERQLISEKWTNRKKRKEACLTNDSAANTLTLYQAMLYANQRSINDGLKTYYKFGQTLKRENALLPDGQFIISKLDFSESNESNVLVSVDESSDGYRLPYYDEWMILARGGKLENRSVWGNNQSLEKVQEYAWVGDDSDYELFSSKPVGLLKPNNFGLYDIFGLAGEFVLFKDVNPFKRLQNTPSCLKGGNYKTRVVDSPFGIYTFPYWKSLDYGYLEANYGASFGGVRLVRKIK